MKKSAPDIIKTSAEGTPSKETTMVNGHPDDSSSVKSRDTEEVSHEPERPNDNDVSRDQPSEAADAESAGKSMVSLS